MPRPAPQLSVNRIRAPEESDAAFRGVAAFLFIAACGLQLAGPAAAIGGGLALFLAGLPHGAFASNGRLLIGRRSYALRYAGLGAASALAFLVMPVFTLAAFLALSAWHFLREAEAGTWLRRAGIAGLAIGGSALVQPGETQAVFAQLCGTAIPSGLMLALACVGAIGYAAALIALARKRSDLALAAMAAGPVLLHPVLATGLVFLLGHAGPVTARLILQRSWPRSVITATVTLSAMLAGAAVLALPRSSALLPYLAAAALAVILPHLLPHRWLLPAARDSAGDQRSQAATSPAT